MADETKSLAAPLSGTASLIVGIIGGIALAASAFVPTPWNTLVGLVGFVGCVLAGLAAKPPVVLEGKPMLQGGALTIATGVMGVLTQFYALIPVGWPQSLALACAGILAWLTGKSLPVLGAAHTPAELAAAVDAGSTASATVDTKQRALDLMGTGVKGPPAS